MPWRRIDRDLRAFESDSVAALVSAQLAGCGTAASLVPSDRESVKAAGKQFSG